MENQPTDVATYGGDLLVNMSVDKFPDTLKVAIIRHMGKLNERMLHDLFNDDQLGDDKRKSHHLRIMNISLTLGTNTMSDTILKKL